MEKDVDMLGIALSGAQAELGGLLIRAIKNDMALRQIKALHGNKGYSECKCGKYNCATLVILNTITLD